MYVLENAHESRAVCLITYIYIYIRCIAYSQTFAYKIAIWMQRENKHLSHHFQQA